MTHRVDSRSLFGGKGGGVARLVRSAVGDVEFKQKQRAAKLAHEGGGVVPQTIGGPVSNRGVLDAFMRGRP